MANGTTASKSKIVWLVDPISAIPGEGLLPSRTWALARAYVAAGHDVIWWTSSFSHAPNRRTPPLRIVEEEGLVSASLHHAATVPIFLADVLQVIVNLLVGSRNKPSMDLPVAILHARIFSSPRSLHRAPLTRLFVSRKN